MKTVKERQKFPIMAGNSFDKIKKVGTRTVEFTYIIHSDGDKQLQGEREVKRQFFH